MSRRTTKQRRAARIRRFVERWGGTGIIDASAIYRHGVPVGATPDALRRRGWHFSFNMDAMQRDPVHLPVVLTVPSYTVRILGVA